MKWGEKWDKNLEEGRTENGRRGGDEDGIDEMKDTYLASFYIFKQTVSLQEPITLIRDCKILVSIYITLQMKN